jgi:hypothetical protein
MIGARVSRRLAIVRITATATERRICPTNVIGCRGLCIWCGDRDATQNREEAKEVATSAVHPKS